MIIIYNFPDDNYWVTDDNYKSNMLPLVSVIVLPILCHGRTGRGLWDQLPVHGSNQYYRQVDSRHLLPSYQYHSDTQLPPPVTHQYYNSDRQLPNTGGYNQGRNIIQKRTLAIDDTENNYEDKQHSPAGFWGQIVNKGVQEAGKDSIPRHSTVSKGIKNQRSSSNNQNSRSHRKRPQRKVQQQKKKEQPVSLKSVQSFYDEYTDDYDEYSYDYDEYNYDYEYYDENTRESDARYKNSNAGMAHGVQNGENEALRAHR